MMPDKEQILATLQSISNDYSLVATLWHAVILIFVVLLFFRVTPTNRLMGILITLPLISVALFAWISGNPFNGSVFAILAILILIFGFRAPATEVETSRLPFLIVGILMILFSLVYPHFLEDATPIRYLVAAPTGLIPCPTLSLVIGLALLFGGFNSPAISITLVVAGLFYGIFGAFRLGVTLDLFLLFGTASLLVQYFVNLRK